MNFVRKILLSFAVFLIAPTPLALAQGTYTQIDVPGSRFTYCFGINTNGDIVGAYSDPNNDYIYGFVLSGGVYTTIGYPGVTITQLTGINDMGQVVGGIGSPNGNLAFVYDIKTQTFTDFQYPGATYTSPLAINNAGIIAGFARLPTSEEVGFERDVSGHKRTIAVPGSIGTHATGITASGVVVGYTFSQRGVIHNFLFSGGKYQRLSIAGAPKAAINGTNPAGTAFVGMYDFFVNNTTFLYQDNTLQILQFPGARSTYAYGVNAAGEVTGFFYTNDKPHGFRWTPPAGAAKK